MFTIMMLTITSQPTICRTRRITKLKVIMDWRILETTVRSIACRREGFDVIVVGGGEVRGVSYKNFTAVYTNTTIMTIFRIIFVR